MYIKVHLREELSKVMEFAFIKMEKNTEDNGSLTKNMV